MFKENRCDLYGDCLVKCQWIEAGGYQTHMARGEISPPA